MGAYEYSGNTVTKAIGSTGQYTFGPTKVKINVTQDNLDSLKVSSINSSHPNAPNSVDRYYTITSTGSGTSDMTFFYDDSELNGQIESNLNVWEYSRGSWTKYDPLSINTDSNLVKITGVTSFSDWVLSGAEDDASLSVELTSFTARQEGSVVVLEWVTESEVENLGFILERREQYAVDSTQEAEEWLKIASYLTHPELRGKGSVTHQTEYRFADSTVSPGLTYDYQLSDVSYDGVVVYHGFTSLTVEPYVEIPDEFTLSQNYPNPFNPISRIRFGLPEQAHVRLTVYDIFSLER